MLKCAILNFKILNYRQNMETIAEKLQREGIELASIQKRALAFLIDDILLNGLLFIIYLPSLMPLFNDPQALSAALSSLILEIIALNLLYHTFFIWRFGATAGKMACKIICLDTTMLSTPSFLNAFLRACMRLLSAWCFYLGFVWAFGNNERQTWQDKIARTIVCEVK